MVERFYDGLTAEVKTVHVALTSAALIITNQEMGLREVWKFTDIKILDFPEDSHPCILTSKEDSDARLHLSDRKTYDALRKKMPNVGLSNVLFTWKMLPVLVVVAACASFGIFKTMPKASAVIAGYIPEEWERNLGERVVTQVTEGKKFCTQKAADAALQKMLARLVAAAPRKEKIELKVVHWPDTPNAFTAPGGKIVIMSGLIDKAESPDEVAGVLAHEMGHAIKHHPTQSAIQSLGWGALLGALSGDASGSGAAQVAVTLMSLGHSRKAEREADTVGLSILENAHISPKGLRAFFERIAKEGPHVKIKGIELLNYLSTHPAPENRAKEIEKAEKSGGAVTPALSDEEWKALRNICATKS